MAGDSPAVVIYDDQANGSVSVKPSNTPPTTSDKPLVVVVSPVQQPIPVTPVPPGASVGVSAGLISLGGGTAGGEFPVRATTYNEQSANAQRSVASSSASDTSAGTGARQVTIVYYDASGGGPYTTTVTLSGATPVATSVSDICFIERIYVSSVGSGGKNVGTITLYVNNTGGGGTIGSIGVGNVVSGSGDNQTFWAHHYVPAGKIANLATFVVSAVSGGSGTNARLFLKTKSVLVPTAPELIISDILLTIGSITRVLGIPIIVSGFTRIIAYGVPGVNNAILTASFDYSEI